jgi:hypothetical protein
MYEKLVGRLVTVWIFHAKWPPLFAQIDPLLFFQIDPRAQGCKLIYFGVRFYHHVLLALGW